MLGYMLDTNIVIYAIKRRPIEVMKVFNRHAGNMCISSITLSELLYGVEKSTQPARNMQQVKDFMARVELLHYDQKAATHYGQIRADLEKKGTVIGVNDLHIAGHARSAGLVLVTNNEKEFVRVEQLRIENWVNTQGHR